MKNKKNIAIIIIAIFAVIAVIVAAVIVISGKNKNSDKTNTSVSTSETTSSNADETSILEETSEYDDYDDTEYYENTDTTQVQEISTEQEITQTTESEQEVTQAQTSEDNGQENAETTKVYTLPTQGDTVSAKFTPYKCITSNGEVISSDFNTALGGSGTSIQLNSDGTYNFILGNIVNSSGTYTLDGNSIELSDGYSGTVSYDEQRTPIAVIISAEGYQAFFN